MEAQIFYWTMGVVATGMGGIFLILLTHGREIATQKAASKYIADQVTNIGKVLDDIKCEVRIVSERLDVFVRNELDEYKSLSRENTNAMKQIANALQK